MFGAVSKRFPSPLFPLTAAIAGIGLLILGAMGVLDPLAARLGRIDHFRRRVESPVAEVRALCDWARENTAPDAVFLAPPDLEGFQIYARRSDVVNFKNTTFTGPDLREWFERVCRLGQIGRLAPDLAEEQWGDPEAVLDHLHQIRRLGQNPQIVLGEGFDLLGQDRVEGLAERYGAEYFATRSATRYNFELAGEAGGFRIFRVGKTKILDR